MIRTALAQHLILPPEVLTDSADLWALRREKILALLDLRGARRARRLACTCRVFSQPRNAAEIDQQAWRDEWRRTRDELLQILGRASALPMEAFVASQGERSESVSGVRRIPLARESERESLQTGYFADADDDEYDTPTRSIDWSTMDLEDGDRATVEMLDLELDDLVEEPSAMVA